MTQRTGVAGNESDHRMQHQVRRGKRGWEGYGWKLTLNTDVDVIFSGSITNVVGERIWRRTSARYSPKDDVVMQNFI